MGLTPLAMSSLQSIAHAFIEGKGLQTKPFA